MDEEGNWFRFVSALLGGGTAIAVAFIVSGNAVSASVRTAYKARSTVRYSHKVAHRTGMSGIYFACGLGCLVIHILLAIYIGTNAFL